jgi:hypothetical protein
MLRRLLLLLTVAATMAAKMALMAMPAFATIHPLAKMECASDNASDVVQSQDPPGLTPPPAGEGPSQGSPPNNPTGSTIAQPDFQANPNAFKEEGC